MENSNKFSLDDLLNEVDNKIDKGDLSSIVKATVVINAYGVGDIKEDSEVI